MQHRHATLTVDTNVGMLMAARGVRDRRQHQPDRRTIQTRQVLGQVNRVTAGQGRHDPQHPLLTTGQGTDRVVTDPGRIEPPLSWLITRLNPRMSRWGEPATGKPDQQLHRRFQRIEAIRPGPQPGMIHSHDESPSLVVFGSTAIARSVPLRV